MRYAIIKENIVANIVELDDVNAWNPPDGCELVAGEANIGDGWDGVRFVASSIPPEQTTPAQIKAEAARRILASYPAWKQVNAALGLYDATTVAAMTTHINAVRLASDAIEARLAADPGLDPMTQPDWPEVV